MFRSKIPDKTRKRVIKLRQSGLKAAEVAKRCEIAKRYVENIMKDFNRNQGRRALAAPVRCPGCRALIVETPCLACSLKRWGKK